MFFFVFFISSRLWCEVEFEGTSEREERWKRKRRERSFFEATLFTKGICVPGARKEEDGKLEMVLVEGRNPWFS